MYKLRFADCTLLVPPCPLCSVEVPTADARMCVRFTVVPTGPAQQAIVVESVAEGSSVAQTGVQRGMRLTAISDPVRRNEVWQLQVRMWLLSSML